MENQQPTPEHEWLKKFVGEWTSEGEMMMDPDKPPMQSKGTESTRELGPFWIITEMSSSHADPSQDSGGCGSNFRGIMQLGYDARQSQFVGSFIDNMGAHLWKYTGTFNDARTAVILNTEGFCPQGTPMKVRETLELLPGNRRRFTSEIQTEDGSWMKILEITATRK